MYARLPIALVLAASSTVLINLAYLREQAAAETLPPLSLRRPVQSVRTMLGCREWVKGFAMESTGFILYVIALALASLALVQSVGAGGIGVLGFFCARRTGHRLANTQTWGVCLSVAGLLMLAISLTDGAGGGEPGSLAGIAAWLGGSVLAALAVLALGRRLRTYAIAQALAGGLLFSVGDFSTKIATQGGGRFAFAAMMILGYGLGTSLLQMAYQSAGALTVAGVATLVTNALPIVGGTVVLHEPVPSGGLGALRVLAFVTVTAGAVLIAAPRGAAQTRREPAHEPAVIPATETRVRDPVSG